MREIKAEYTGGLHSSFTDARKTINASLSCPPDRPATASAFRTLAAAIVTARGSADAAAAVAAANVATAAPLLAQLPLLYSSCRSPEAKSKKRRVLFLPKVHSQVLLCLQTSSRYSYSW